MTICKQVREVGWERGREEIAVAPAAVTLAPRLFLCAPAEVPEAEAEVKPDAAMVAIADTDSDESDVDEGVKIVSYDTMPFRLVATDNLGMDEGVEDEYVVPTDTKAVEMKPLLKSQAQAPVPPGLPRGAHRTAFDDSIDDLKDKPWRTCHDVGDYFNYDMNEYTWKVREGGGEGGGNLAFL